MGIIRYRWLRFLGYVPYRYIRVAHHWDDEEPPAFGYYMKLKMLKRGRMKVVKFKNASNGEELTDLLKSEEVRGE